MTRQPSLFGHGGAASELPARLRQVFEWFWAAYPECRPNPRALAEAEFAKLVRNGVEPETLVRAASGYARDCANLPRGQVPCHARTFLAQGRWRDYLPEPEPETPPAAAAPIPEEPEHDLDAVRPRVAGSDWRLWIAPLRLVTHDLGQRALIGAPSRFHASRVRSEFGAAIRGALGVRSLDILAEEDIQP